MDLVQASDAAEFLERAAPLLADEARHNLILGIAGTIRDNPNLYPERNLWLVEDAGSVVGAALQTPPQNLVLGAGTDEGLGVLARSVADLPGAVGSLPEVEQFAQAWTDEHGGRAEIRREQGIYAADEVIPPSRPAPGSARAATKEDEQLLVDWWRAFVLEALGEEDSDDGAPRMVRHRLATPGNGIALWEADGEPVSLVAYGSPTPTGVRVGPVYTPHEQRARGYASALTAHVTAEQLAGGRSFCFLYTDLANPTSNKIYVAIGYRRVCDSIQYAFV